MQLSAFKGRRNEKGLFGHRSFDRDQDRKTQQWKRYLHHRWAFSSWWNFFWKVEGSFREPPWAMATKDIQGTNLTPLTSSWTKKKIIGHHWTLEESWKSRKRNRSHLRKRPTQTVQAVFRGSNLSNESQSGSLELIFVHGGRTWQDHGWNDW